MSAGREIFYRYLQEAPLPLALERSFEALLMSQEEFVPPIMDLGCGDSIFASIACKQPIDLGVDPDGSELQRARLYGAHRELLAVSGASVPRPSESFATVFSNSVLEHIPELDAVLTEVHRLLRPDGRFYLTVPTDRFEQYTLGYQLLSSLGLTQLASRYASFFNSFWDHFHAYSVEEWKRRFARHGFEVLRVQEYCPRGIGLLDDATAPLCLPNFVVKKLLNRWFLLPPLRKATALAPYFLFRSLVKLESGPVKGGIVFFALGKTDQRTASG